MNKRQRKKQFRMQMKWLKKYTKRALGGHFELRVSKVDQEARTITISRIRRHT